MKKVFALPLMLLVFPSPTIPFPQPPIVNTLSNGPYIPPLYLQILESLYLYVHNTGKTYVYPDPHVKILSVIRPKKGPIMVFIGFEDLEDLRYAQFNDLFLNIEINGDWAWLEGRFTGLYRKSLYLIWNGRRYHIATYHTQVWFTIALNVVTGEIYRGEYWR